MPIIEKFNFSQILLNQTIQQNENITAKLDSKISDYFDYIYTYPPKLRIKWSTIDNLNEDPLTKEALSDQYSFDELEEYQAFTSAENKAISKKYTFSQYGEGYLSKIASSNFFAKKTKTIQAELENIPIYAILNGQREIVLSKPSNLLGSKTIQTFFDQTIYNQFGSFDQSVEKKQQLGLFFLNSEDADNYLQEIARLDAEGTQTVGLSIHCTNLKSAYRVTREYHPGIDFRFVPKLEEIKNLLESKTFQNNEYFKGVPIYIVKLADGSSKNSLNYVFFEKTQADEFIKIKKVNSIISNLEDLLEEMEDERWGKDVKEKPSVNLEVKNAYYFVTPSESLKEVIEFNDTYQRNVIRDFGQTLNLKFRIFKRYAGVFFSVK